MQNLNYQTLPTGMLKDKNRPKNPMSAYACFIQVIREEHRRKHPNEHVDFSEFSKKCAEKWRTMTDNEKKRFEDMAAADRMRFNREMSQYIPPDGLRMKKRKMPKDPTKPKRAWSAFFFFCDEFRPKVREQHPDWRVGEVAKELGKMWEACNDKSKYENLAQDARQKYEEEMVQYRAGTFLPKSSPSMGGEGSSVGVNMVSTQLHQGGGQGQMQHVTGHQQQNLNMMTNNSAGNVQQQATHIQQQTQQHLMMQHAALAAQQQMQHQQQMQNMGMMNPYVTAAAMMPQQHMLATQNGGNVSVAGMMSAGGLKLESDQGGVDNQAKMA